MSILPMLRSLKTTLTAVFAAIVGGVIFLEALLDSDPSTIPDADGLLIMCLAAITALQGLFARDADISSEGTQTR
jgi:hypothetical protein